MTAWFFIILCTLCWGAWAVAEKVAVQHSSPIMMLLIKAYAYSALAPIVFMYMKIKNEDVSWNISGATWTLTSFILATIASVSFAAALQKMHTHIVLGVTSSYPIITFLLCSTLLNEQVSGLKVLGVVLVTVGVAFLTL